MSNQTAIAPIDVPPSQYWEGNDGPWSTFAIHVGSPPQPARVLVSTVLGETWVISANRTQGGCLDGDDSDCPRSRGALFNVNRSTTWNDQGVFALGAEVNLPDYTSEYNNGNYGLDRLGFGLSSDDGITLDNLVISAIGTKDFFLGNLGVTSRPTNFTSFEDPQPSLLSALKAQNHIPSLAFGYSAGNEYRLRKVLGSLTLGGYDQSKFFPNDVSFQFGPDVSRDLLVGLQSITYNDARTVDQRLLPEGILAFVDSTVPHIWLPEEACTAFEEAFGLRYNSRVQRYLVNDTLHDSLQANNASVSFILGNEIFGGNTINITLPYQAFDLEVAPPIVNSTTKYFPLRRADNETQYTLGRTFLQESYLIVDYERSNFSISQSRFERDVQAQIITISPKVGGSIEVTRQSSGFASGAIAGIVVGIGVLIALIAGFSFFLIRRRRRRQHMEDEKRKAAEAFDPMSKPEMDGDSKIPPGELYADNKPGSEVEGRKWNEMDASKEHVADKLRAEMEGSRGGTEVEGTKGGHEMQASAIIAPVELWAGSDGLHELHSISPREDDGHPSPANRVPSSSGSGRPSSASASDRRAIIFTPFNRRHRASPSLRDDGNISAPSTPIDVISGPESSAETWSGRPSPRPTPPPRIYSPQGATPTSSGRQERMRRGDNLTRRLESSSATHDRTQSSGFSPTTTDSETDGRRRPEKFGTYVPNSSLVADSDAGERKEYNQGEIRSHDRWNERFGSRARDHITSPLPSNSPSSDGQLPPISLEPSREAIGSVGRSSERSRGRAVTQYEEDGSQRSGRSNTRRTAHDPSGFF